MARTDSEEEIQLRKRARRRLVGAVALVIVSVVILPMVLDSEPKRVVHEIDIQIPSENSVAEFTPKIVPEPLKAKQQQQNLTTNGITTYTENIKTEKGEVTRVRIGPFSVRSEAEEMRNRLKGLGINGVVTAP